MNSLPTYPAAILGFTWRDLPTSQRQAGGSLTVVVAALKSATPGAAPEAAPLGSTSDGGEETATFSPMARVAVYGSDGAPLVVAEMQRADGWSIW